MQVHIRCEVFYAFLACAVVLVSIPLNLRADFPKPIVLKLWNDDSSKTSVDAGPEVMMPDGGVRNVSIPEISIYLPTSTHTLVPALLVCPGGGYREVGEYTSGMQTVDYLVPKGFAIIVLKYRTSPPSKDYQTDALCDAKRAVRLVRHHAREWRIDSHKIGAIGSSAGSHLILNLATHADSGNSNASDPIEQEGSRLDFMGMACIWPNNQLPKEFPIDQHTSPAFIAAAEDDSIAPIEFSQAIVDAYKKVGNEAMLWTVKSGGHTAFVLGAQNEGSAWIDHFINWASKILRSPN